MVRKENYCFTTLFSCDADPAALAKYVVALVRKDKPLGELEEICIDQLEVFLGGGRFVCEFVNLSLKMCFINYLFPGGNIKIPRKVTFRKQAFKHQSKAFNSCTS